MSPPDEEYREFVGQAQYRVDAARGHGPAHHHRGQPTLALTAVQDAFASNKPSSGYQETLVVNARTDGPIMVQAGAHGAPPSGAVSYQISRVTLSDVAAGKF